MKTITKALLLLMLIPMILGASDPNRFQQWAATLDGKVEFDMSRSCIELGIEHRFAKGLVFGLSLGRYFIEKEGDTNCLNLHIFLRGTSKSTNLFIGPVLNLSLDKNYKWGSGWGMVGGVDTPIIKRIDARLMAGFLTNAFIQPSFCSMDCFVTAYGAIGLNFAF